MSYIVIVIAVSYCKTTLDNCANCTSTYHITKIYQNQQCYLISFNNIQHVLALFTYRMLCYKGGIIRFSNCLCNCYTLFPLFVDCGRYIVYSAILPLRYPQEKPFCVTRRNLFQPSQSSPSEGLLYGPACILHMAISSRANRFPACYIYIRNRNERASNVCEWCYMWLTVVLKANKYWKYWVRCESYIYQHHCCSHKVNMKHFEWDEWICACYFILFFNQFILLKV
jgi:hypothetical protein